MEMNAIFYSAAEMITDFLEFRQKWTDNGATIMKEGEEDNDDDNNDDQDEIDEQLFYEYVSQKCDRKYSRYMLNKIHKKIRFQ